MGVRIVEPVPVVAGVRYRAREIVRSMVHAPGAAAYRRSLIGLDQRDAAINFGWIDEPPRPAEALIGGGVKLTHLRERFGEGRRGFSAIYLVSSLLHLMPHVEALVEWAKESGVPVVWNQNGVAYPAWCGDFYPWFNDPMRRCIELADRVVYQSEFCRRRLGSVSG